MPAFYVLAASVIVGTAVQDRRSKKIAAAQKEQADTERAIQGEESARAKRQSRAQAQVARAEIENSAASGGQTLGSAAIAGGQSITAQNADNEGQINFATGKSNLLSHAAQNVQKAGRSSFGELLLTNAASQGASMGSTMVGKKLGSTP